MIFFLLGAVFLGLMVVIHFTIPEVRAKEHETRESATGGPD